MVVTHEQHRPPAEPGRLLARPRTDVYAGGAGLQSLDLASGRDGLLYIPPHLPADRPAPLVLALHGAGGEARQSVERLEAAAAEFGCVLVAPDSRGSTWDHLRDHRNADVAFIDRALGVAFDRHAVDPACVATEGFSDGASCALSLGLTNGDLFTHVLAFSPGFCAPARRCGRPHVFLAHGTADPVLPVGRSRQVVAGLRGEGYAVVFREFAGPHTVPPKLVREAIGWFAGPWL
jgi:phospholipase/carboxylesterase